MFSRSGKRLTNKNSEDAKQGYSPEPVSKDAPSHLMMGTNKSFGFLEWEFSNGEVILSGLLWKALGFSRTQSIIPVTQQDFYDRVSVVDRVKFESIIQRLSKSNQQESCILQMRKSDGKACWIDLQLNSIGVVDKPYKDITGTAYDVTNIKFSEKIASLALARYERILQVSSDGIWEWSARENGFHLSQSCWESIGYTKDDEIIKQHKNSIKIWKDHIHPEDVSRFESELSHCISQREFLDIDYRIRDKFGDWHWIHARAKMTYDNRGEIAFISGCNVDVTSQKALYEQLKESKESADTANSKKSEFLSNMSHELRTPLNSIIGFTQLFEFDSNLTQEQRDNVNEINTAGDHLLALIDDVLDLAKIEAGGAAIELQSILPSKIIKECLTLVRPLADMKGISTQLNVPKSLLETRIELNKMRFKQVMLNLLSNAIKYNRNMGKVDVFLEKHTSYLRVSVQDNGIGIPESVQDKVFDAFDRLGAENTEVNGTGIGLVLTKELTEKMHGRIGFSSEESQGSIFWVEFPLDSLVNDAETNVTEENLSKDHIKGIKLNGVETEDRNLTFEGNLSHVDPQDVSHVFDDLAEVAENEIQGEFSTENRSDSVEPANNELSSGKLNADMSSSYSDHQSSLKRLPELNFSNLKNILYIEENPTNRRLLEQTLSRQNNIKLTLAKDALRGMYELRVGAFDAVILDMNLSAVNAYEVLDVLKAESKFEELKVIAISSDGMMKERERAISSGFDEYLTKPIDLGDLFLSLKKLLS